MFAIDSLGSIRRISGGGIEPRRRGIGTIRTRAYSSRAPWLSAAATQD